MTLNKAKEKKKMKTRSNMPLFVLECDNVKTLSNSQIDLLRCGDYLVKKDASGEHAYKVTFKSATGMCITYHDASVIETQSYDKVGNNWVYNSEDKTSNLLDLPATLEEIKDADGHNRFIEGDGEPLELEGFTTAYCRWSLSGTHLMMVLAGSFADGTTKPASSSLAKFYLPEWVMDKIYGVFGTTRVEVKKYNLWGDDWTQESPTPDVVLTKGATYMEFIDLAGAMTMTKKRSFRIEFDILIDNE